MGLGACPRHLRLHRLVRRDLAERIDATLILEALREAGILLPAAVPDRLLLIALGALAVIFVLIRLISVPDTYFVSTGRGIGIYISLLAALGLLGAGLVRTAEDLP